jgi:hypothetical protein
MLQWDNYKAMLDDMDVEQRSPMDHSLRLQNILTLLRFLSSILPCIRLGGGSDNFR